MNQSDMTESPAKKMKMVELVDDDELIMGNRVFDSYDSFNDVIGI